MQDILTTDHILWDEFANQMREREECDGTTKYARSILERMAETAPIDIESTLNWLKNKGGYCDCEILLNVCLNRE